MNLQPLHRLVMVNKIFLYNLENHRALCEYPLESVERAGAAVQGIETSPGPLLPSGCFGKTRVGSLILSADAGNRELTEDWGTRALCTFGPRK